MSTDQQASPEPFAPGARVYLTGESVSDDGGMNLRAARPGLAYTVFSHSHGGESGRAFYLLDIPNLTFGGAHWAYAEHVEAYPEVVEVDEAKTWTVTFTAADLGWLAQRFHENADGLTHAGVHDKPRVIKALTAVFDALAERDSTPEASR